MAFTQENEPTSKGGYIWMAWEHRTGAFYIGVNPDPLLTNNGLPYWKEVSHKSDVILRDNNLETSLKAYINAVTGSHKDNRDASIGSIIKIYRYACAYHARPCLAKKQ